MPDPTLGEVYQALANQLQTTLDPTVELLQVSHLYIDNPSPPTIDMLPSDPFQDQIAFGAREIELFLDVRARVSMAENEAGQDLLTSLMDPRASTSLVLAVISDRTLGGKVQDIAPGPPSNYGEYVGARLDGPKLLGCTWRMRVIL